MPATDMSDAEYENLMADFQALAPELYKTALNTERKLDKVAEKKSLLALPAPPKTAKEEFKESALAAKAAHEELRSAVKSAASKLGMSAKDVSRKVREYGFNKEKERVMTLMRAAQACDLVFCLDATGSMGSILDAVKSELQSILDELNAMMGNQMKVRIGVVAYRDVNDGPKRLEVLPLTANNAIATASKFVGGLQAMGGADPCEDAISGLAAAADLDWKLPVKVLIWCGDAPCHGRQYHDGVDDDYPDGKFPGSQPVAPVLEKLRHKSVDLTFLKLTKHTDTMIRKFNEEAGAECIHTSVLGVDHEHGTAAAIREGVKESSKTALKMSVTNSLGVHTKIIKDKTLSLKVDNALLRVDEELDGLD